MLITKIVAAHAGLAGHAGRDDHHVRALDRRVILGPDVLGVEAVNGRGLRDVEPLPLRDAFGDVEENDVPEFLQADEVGQRAANLSRADKRDLLSSHVSTLLQRRPYSASSRITLIKPDLPSNPIPGMSGMMMWLSSTRTPSGKPPYGWKRSG